VLVVSVILFLVGKIEVFRFAKVQGYLKGHIIICDDPFLSPISASEELWTSEYARQTA
jgi:hypothetical protein